MALPWVPEVFLACGGNFRCWPKANTSSAVGRSREGHYKDLTETGNRARKVSGTQGKMAPKETKKKMLMQNFGFTTKSIMVCYGIFWNGQYRAGAVGREGLVN